MKVLLFTPTNRSYVIVPRLGLAYLAAIARRAGHQVTLLDCLKERLDHPGFDRFLRGHRFDVVGAPLYSYDLPSVERHLAAVRRRWPHAVTVAGGPHPSAAPEHTLRHLADLDYAFRGEAEIGFPLLLDHLAHGRPALGEVPGLVYRLDGTIRTNERTFVENLDGLPRPAWDLVEPESYPAAPHGAFSKRFPTAPIIITRGCPFTCTFCAGSSVTGRRVRRRSVDDVLAELGLLRTRGIREFHVEDENFTAHRPTVLELCHRLQEERLDMSWSLPAGVRIDSLDRPLLETMAAAGCYSMALGIEFGTQRMLDVARKGLSLELVREKMQLFRDLPIKTTGFFLFGLPGETLDQMRATLALALELELDRAQFNNFVPLPGSEAYDQLRAAGELGEPDWERCFVHDVAYVNDDLGPRARKRLQREAYLRFYLRPRVLKPLLAELRSPAHLAHLLRRFWDALR